LRAAIRDGSPLGRRVAAIVERGELVPDALIGEVMEERLSPEGRGARLSSWTAFRGPSRRRTFWIGSWPGAGRRWIG